jgi:uncharacterized protein
VRRIARWLVLLYVGSAGLLVLIEQLAIHCHPRDGEVQGSGRDVWLTTEDGVRIYARYYERDPSLPVLLYLHGAAGTLASRSDRLELFASLGANLLAVEYRGYGPSEGTPSTRGLEHDARAAYTWLRRRTAASLIVPFGESLGGGPASWLASQFEVGGLILLSTSTSASALASHYMPWLPTRWLLRLDFDTLAKVARVTAPKLFIHSRADGVVPFAMAEALWSAAPTPKQHLWLDDVGHDETFYRARPQATEAMREFLSSL